MAPGGAAMPPRGMRFWGLVSAALHVALLVLGLVFGLPRPLQEPQEEAIAVEVVTAPQLAQGEQPAPVAGPPSVTQPARPEPPGETTVADAVPSPPPPAPIPAPAPQAPIPAPAPQALPKPSAPPPEPAPKPPQQVAEAKPRPAPPPEPTPSPLPLPPPPIPVPAPPRPVAETRPEKAEKPDKPEKVEKPEKPTEKPAPKPQQVAEAKPEKAEKPSPTPAPARPEATVPRPPAPTPPQPSKEAGTGRTPPVQKPQADSRSVLNTLDKLMQSAQQNRPPTGKPSPAAGTPQQGGGAPTGTATLSAGEKAGLADKISECWSVDGGGLGINSVVVELRVDVDAGGVVRNVRANGSPPSDPRARSVYEAARRALLDPKCNPLPLPRERLAALRDTIFRFNPRDLGLR